MKKNFIAALLGAAALLLLLGGCGTDAPTGEAAPDKDAVSQAVPSGDAVSAEAPVSEEQPAPAGTRMSLEEEQLRLLPHRRVPGQHRQRPGQRLRPL